MKKTLRVERLAKREEKATIKRIFYLSILSIISAIFIFTLGIPLLGKLADILNSVFTNKDRENLTSTEVSNPPRLDDLPSATNSATLTISGFAQEATAIVIYLNEEEFGKVEVIDGEFNFEDLKLKNGENQIWAKAVTKSGRESNPSQGQTVFLDQEEPTLEIDNPADGQSFSGNNRILVSGKTEAVAQVYANGFLANINPEGKFEVSIPVSEGENIIEIKATDDAGNVKIENRKINFKK